MDLATNSAFTNWGDFKSNWIKTNQTKCWFLVRGENKRTRGKTSQNRVENQQTQSTYDSGSGNLTRVTLVEGECSHHCADPALWKSTSSVENQHMRSCDNFAIILIFEFYNMERFHSGDQRECFPIKTKENRIQFPEDWLGTTTWPPFLCLGTSTWPPWRHVTTLYWWRTLQLDRKGRRSTKCRELKNCYCMLSLFSKPQMW